MAKPKSKPTVTLKVTIGNQSGKTWTESWSKYTANITQEEAEQECRRLVSEFNETEQKRYGETVELREFKSVEIIKDTDENIDENYDILFNEDVLGKDFF
jgi:hypothetical protein